jgi:hypothetical protein
MEHNIFISYSRKDLAKAKQIISWIESNIKEAKCWYDIDGIESSDQFEHVIIKAIDACQIVVFLLSEHSMCSNYTEKEIKYATNINKKIVVLKIDNHKLEGWYLFTFSTIDIINYDNKEQKGKLLRDLGKWLAERPTPGPIPPIPPAPDTKKSKIIQRGILAFILIVFCISGYKLLVPKNHQENMVSISRDTIPTVTVAHDTIRYVDTILVEGTSHVPFHYIGDMLDSLPHGHGKAVYEDGREYVGEFQFGKRHGNATFKFSDGNIFEGTFVNDSLDYGVFTSTQKNSYGIRFTGQFKHDAVFNGVWQNANGDTIRIEKH